jgi:hypothetical protein
MEIGWVYRFLPAYKRKMQWTSYGFIPPNETINPQLEFLYLQLNL